MPTMALDASTEEAPRCGLYPSPCPARTLTWGAQRFGSRPPPTVWSPPDWFLCHGGGPTERIFSVPSQPYTEALLSAVPKSEPDQHKERIILKGETANSADLPSGCYFHPRCHYAEDICRQESPPWVEVAPGHHAACHFNGELTLAAIGTPSS
ncbi:MAG: hypothetical protein F4Z18_11275 [Caldilineaceae bacterium SB0666_bin_21]|nr:hypothetical protein [Caldilineaceae bacterium SB0666_bin_21]